MDNPIIITKACKEDLAKELLQLINELKHCPSYNT